MTDTTLSEQEQLRDELGIQPPEPQEAPQGPQEAAQEPAQQPIMESAFVVYMNPQGHWTVHPDVHAAAEMQIMRQPNVDDYFNGCSTVLREIAVQETAGTAAQMAVQLQQQALQQMAEQARQAQMNEQIGKFTGGAAPGNIPDLSQLKRR